MEGFGNGCVVRVSAEFWGGGKFEGSHDGGIYVDMVEWFQSSIEVWSHLRCSFCNTRTLAFRRGRRYCS